MGIFAWLSLLVLGALLVGCGVPERAAGDPPSSPKKQDAPPSRTRAASALPTFIPQPKQVTPGEGSFRLAGGFAWSVTGGRQRGHLVGAVRELLGERFGVAPGQVRTYAGEGDAVVLRLGDGAAGRRPAGSEGAAWRRNAEGYRLAVTGRGIEIAAPSARGAFYGVQTLAQLLRRSGEGLECRAVTVEDWPSMRFRGAHWFPSASGVPFHRKLIARVMARYKMNAAVIQCEAARWETHPEIAAPNSIKKEELRGLVRSCRESFLDPIPLVNCPGHGEWMFRNGQNLHFAEDRQTPYAYCVTHPSSDRFIKSVLGETLEVFQPQWVHLGHDEVTLKGRFPSPDCPRCAGRSTTELVLQNANRLSAWLRERGARTMIWGDMLLAREEAPNHQHAPNVAEARARRAGLPKKLLIADWHYSANPRYPSLDLFHHEGFDTVACTWYNPENIWGFSQAALKAGSRGLLQTTWAGYFPDEAVLGGKERRQFEAFILAAEYAWSGRPDRPNALPYDPTEVFRRAYAGEP